MNKTTPLILGKIVIALSIMILMPGCLLDNTPPDVNTIQQQFQNSYDDIQIIIEFMVNSEYDNIYIHNASGTMVADLNDVKILDSGVIDAVNRILSSYVGINKISNTIYLLQWKGTRDIGCGIAYSINGMDTPIIEFATELIPISEDGWYYYVSDYNKWRSNVH